MWDDFINPQTVVGAANVPITDAMVFLSNFKVRGAALKTKKGGSSGADSNRVWDGKSDLTLLKPLAAGLALMLAAAAFPDGLWPGLARLLRLLKPSPADDGGGR